MSVVTKESAHKMAVDAKEIAHKMPVDTKESAHKTLLVFLRAANKIRSMQLGKLDLKEERMNEEPTKYTLVKRLDYGLLCNETRREKWTQTSSGGKSDVIIDGRECWNYGTLSHSLLQVRNCRISFWEQNLNRFAIVTLSKPTVTDGR